MVQHGKVVRRDVDISLVELGAFHKSVRTNAGEAQGLSEDRVPSHTNRKSLMVRRPLASCSLDISIVLAVECLHRLVVVDLMTILDL